MTTKTITKICLFVALGLASVVFNACKEDAPKPSATEQPDPTDTTGTTKPIDPSDPAKPEERESVVINGVTWATRNVASSGTFAATPESYGIYYSYQAQNVCPSGYRLPTKSELESLINSGSTWTNRNGTKGRIFGNGSNTIFLPAAGNRGPNDRDGVHSPPPCTFGDCLGSYGSSTREDIEGAPYDVKNAYYLSFDSDRMVVSYDYIPYYRSVRCVAGGAIQEVVVTNVSLNKTETSLPIGDSETLIATVLPANATNKTVTWTSSDDWIATVDANGKITAIEKGTTTITAEIGDKTAVCEVVVYDPKTHDKGVVINGVTWATRNVDEYGTFVAAPENAGELHSGYSAMYDAVCPYGWQVPTKVEMNKLIDAANVSNEWVTLNGVNGRKFTDKTTSVSLFLPAAGYQGSNINLDGPLCEQGAVGNYWSSSTSFSGSNFANSLFFTSGNTTVYTDNLVLGRFVRCVAK
ncbi:MAG: Ig-like domain-containing protein [Bacteroidetes bacterium]|nr:Ig-like domain-containing protein [Bacteroidota bacterium]